MSHHDGVGISGTSFSALKREISFLVRSVRRILVPVVLVCGLVAHCH